MITFLNTLYTLFIDMGFYLMLGLALIALLNIVIKKQWISRHLGQNNLWGSVKASLFGVPLPLCSCGVVPTALYLKEQGASTATVISFLISTPQTGVDSILATFGMMGLTLAWYRPLAAFISGVTGGSVAGLLERKGRIDTTVKESHHHQHTGSCCDGGDCTVGEAEQDVQPTLFERVWSSIRYAFGEFLSDISVHFVVGLIIAALISVLIPEDLLVRWGLGSGIVTMLLMIVVGLPMYICSTSSIPIALTLMAKGISPGAAFVFLFVGPLTNAASLSMIIKKLGKKVTALYVGVSIALAIAFGLILDVLLETFNLPVVTQINAPQMEGPLGILKLAVSGAFLLLLLYSLLKRFTAMMRRSRSAKDTAGPKTTFYIEGVDCQGCANHIKDALLKLSCIDRVEIDLDEKRATVWGRCEMDPILGTVRKLGYGARAS